MGRNPAESMGRHISDYGISLIYDSDLVRTRRELDIAYRRGVPQVINGVQSIASGRLRPKHESAWNFVFPHEVAPAEIWEYLRTQAKLKHAVNPGMLAVYFNRKGKFTHIGVTVPYNLVISKWGMKDVYRHDCRLVPSGLGDYLLFLEVTLPEKFAINPQIAQLAKMPITDLTIPKFR